MAAWAYILTFTLGLSLLIFISLALAFTYQKIHCIGDVRILCWADWTCGENGTPVNVFTEYFSNYSNKCLFGKGPDTCNCGNNATDAPPPEGDTSDMGFLRSTTSSDANSQSNPYDTTSANVHVYDPSLVGSNMNAKNNSSQNLCGSNYPITNMVGPVPKTT